MWLSSGGSGPPTREDRCGAAGQQRRRPRNHFNGPCIIRHILSKLPFVPSWQDDAGDVCYAEPEAFAQSPFPLHVDIVSTLFREACGEKFSPGEDKLFHFGLQRGKAPE